MEDTMGSGRWSTDTYDARAATRHLAGKSAFDYTDTLRRALPRDRWAPHPSLDPRGVRTREGGGGGHDTESYELALYFMARHTSLDCVEKRGRKGYLFLIGDERSYARVSRRQVAHIIGDTLQEDIPVEQIVAELTRRYEVFYILPPGAAHGGDHTILDHWRALLGQHVLELDDPDAVCETIALAIGLCEDAIALADGAN